MSVGYSDSVIHINDKSLILGMTMVTSIKAVINRCHGGFSLSKKAYEFLGIEWGEQEELWGAGFEFSEDRSNPKLIECVEKLGTEASGECSNLTVAQIVVEASIKSVDGLETFVLNNVVF